MPKLSTYPSVLLTGLFLIFFNQKSIAQYPGMKAVYQKMNQDNMQAMIRMQNMGMTYRGAGAGGENNFKYKFTVIMKDSTQKVVESMIFTDTTLHKDYLLLFDKKYPKSDSSHRFQKIYADQTLSISRPKTIYTSHPVYYDGMATDSCWLFKAISGKITAYSYLSEKDGMYFEPYTIVAIQLKDGPMVKLNADNLKQMIREDKDAMEYFDKKKYYKAIKKYNSNSEKTP